MWGIITAKCRVCGRRYWFNRAWWQAECCAKEDKMFDINTLGADVMRMVERRKR